MSKYLTKLSANGKRAHEGGANIFFWRVERGNLCLRGSKKAFVLNCYMKGIRIGMFIAREDVKFIYREGMVSLNVFLVCVMRAFAVRPSDYIWIWAADKLITYIEVKRAQRHVIVGAKSLSGRTHNYYYTSQKIMVYQSSWNFNKLKKINRC